MLIALLSAWFHQQSVFVPVNMGQILYTIESFATAAPTGSQLYHIMPMDSRLLVIQDVWLQHLLLHRFL